MRTSIIIMLCLMFCLSGCLFSGGPYHLDPSLQWEYFEVVKDFILNPNTIAAARGILDYFDGADAKKVSKILGMLEMILRQLPRNKPQTFEFKRQFEEVKNRASLYPNAPETTSAIKTLGHQLLDEAHIEQAAIVKQQYLDFIKERAVLESEHVWALEIAKKETQDLTVLLYAETIIEVISFFQTREDALAICTFAIKICDLNLSAAGVEERKTQLKALKAKIESASTVEVSQADFMQAIGLASDVCKAAKETLMKKDLK